MKFSKKKKINSHTAFGSRNYWLCYNDLLKSSSVTSVTSIFTKACQNTSPHWIYVALYGQVRDTFDILTEVHIGVIFRIHLIIEPGPLPNSSYTCSMGFMTGDKTGQGKTLTLFWEWNCVVIYALCEALHCHAGKCQFRYFAWND